MKIYQVYSNGRLMANDQTIEIIDISKLNSISVYLQKTMASSFHAPIHVMYLQAIFTNENDLHNFCCKGGKDENI